MIQSGIIELGDGAADSPEWTLNVPGPEGSEGGAPRTSRSLDIPFKVPFELPPRIIVALAVIDAEHQFNLRVTVSAEEVQAEEFNIRVTTFGDSLIYSVLVSWIAHD